MLARPRALLLDEPFSALDPRLRTSIREFVMGEIVRAQIPALLVTHEREDREGSSEIHLGLSETSRSVFSMSGPALRPNNRS
jgi:ABC-type uncharacterized transport system YnjBCD ATPase subunit